MIDQLTLDWQTETLAAAAAEKAKGKRFVAGLDLGQLSDYSALAVVEVVPEVEAGKKVRRHSVLALKRWELRTPYGHVVEDVVKAFAREPLTGSPLVVDRTGVGVAVAETLVKARPKARVVQATITGGAETSYKDGAWCVPKRELAGVLQVLLGTRRFQVAQGLPLGETLKRELERFTVKINIATGHESFEAWRESDKDDLVLATTLACWFAEKGQKPFHMFC
jgi:hypothetical protein